MKLQIKESNNKEYINDPNNIGSTIGIRRACKLINDKNINIKNVSYFDMFDDTDIKVNAFIEQYADKNGKLDADAVIKGWREKISFNSDYDPRLPLIIILEKVCKMSTIEAKQLLRCYYSDI